MTTLLYVLVPIALVCAVYCIAEIKQAVRDAQNDYRSEIDDDG